jgi:membrane protein required for colicin V production
MIFDTMAYLLLVFAVATGFSAGFLRSLATIIGYVAAMPIAVAATPWISGTVVDRFAAPWSQSSTLFCAVFLVVGIVLGGLLRFCVSEIVGPSVSIPDRLAGSLFGAVRIVLVAVTVVLIFDQLVPADRQPSFLNGSRLRPILSLVAQTGVKSLPADVTAYIDQLKRTRRM